MSSHEIALTESRQGTAEARLAAQPHRTMVAPPALDQAAEHEAEFAKGGSDPQRRNARARRRHEDAGRAPRSRSRSNIGRSTATPDAQWQDGDRRTLIVRAAAIAAAGLPVFPLTKNKRPFAGSHGHKDATCNPDQVLQLFRKPGASLIGVPTGERSGLMVVDIDPRNGGSSWESDAKAAGILAGAAPIPTPSGGRHYYFRFVPGTRCSNSKIAPGVDIKAEGGLVAWYAAAPPHEPRFPDAPAALVELIRAANSPVLPTFSDQPVSGQPNVATSDVRLDAYVRKVLNRVEEAPDGTKHDVLLQASYTLGRIGAGHGLNREELAEKLERALVGRNVKSTPSARRTIQRGLEMGWQRPRDLPDRSHRPDLQCGKRPSSHNLGSNRIQVCEPPTAMWCDNSWDPYNDARREDCLAIIRAEAGMETLKDSDRSYVLVIIYGNLVAVCEPWDHIVEVVQRDIGRFFSPRWVAERFPAILRGAVKLARDAASGGPDLRVRYRTATLVEMLQPTPGVQLDLRHIVGVDEKNRRRRLKDLQAGRVVRPHAEARADRDKLGLKVQDMRAQGRTLTAIAKECRVSLSTVERACRAPRTRNPPPHIRVE
jgi:hypothetical protein